MNLKQRQQAKAAKANGYRGCESDCGICYVCTRDAWAAGEPLLKFHGPFGVVRLTAREGTTVEMRGAAQEIVQAKWKAVRTNA